MPKREPLLKGLLLSSAPCCYTCAPRALGGSSTSPRSTATEARPASASVHCATGFAVEGPFEALHAELAPLGIRVTVVEPGYFRTAFLDALSLSASATRIADYDATAGRVRRLAVDLSHRQPGDPTRLAAVPVAFAGAADPPVRLPLGSDTVAAIEAKHAADREVLAA